MNKIKEIYCVHSFYGYRRIAFELKDQGHIVNHKCVLRLMQKMNIQAIYPKKNLSKRRQEDIVYPYLLKDHPPLKPHDVWCTDITYIRMNHGFLYLTALIDVVSRYIMGWHLSTTLSTKGCLEALDMALKTGHKPVIINSDQGCQFTSTDWINALTKEGVKISMDGKGRCLDNIPIERFWWSLKYEEVYLKTYETVKEARLCIGYYIYWYNTKRRHCGLNYNRPHDVMKGYKVATFWAFMKPIACENVENDFAFSHNSTGTTTSIKFLNKQKDLGIATLSLN